MLTLKAAVIRRSGPDEWHALWGEVENELERARGDPEVRQRFVTAARSAH